MGEAPRKKFSSHKTVHKNNLAEWFYENWIAQEANKNASIHCRPV